MDGEGYIGLLPCKGKDVVNKSFSPVIKIKMTGTTARLIMYAIKENYGGYVERQTRLTIKGREVYGIVLKSKVSTMKFVDDIYPYLIVKREQADILREFCALPYEHPKSPRYNPEVSRQREYYYYRLKELKQPESLAQTE